MRSSILDPKRVTIGVVAGLLLGIVALAAGTLYFAFQGRPTLIVPGVRGEVVSLPSEVPESSLRNFAILYLLYFDDYSPATIEDRTKFLLRLVSSDRVEAARRSLEERATYVIRARESSLLSPPLPEAVTVERTPRRTYQIEVKALRRTFIADAPKEVMHVRYRLDLVPTVPSETNPYGLVVAGQAIESRPASDTGTPRKEP